MANSAASEMTILNAKNNKSSDAESERVFHTTCGLTLTTTITAVLISSLVLFYYPADELFFSNETDGTILKTTLWCLITYTMITLFGGLWDAAYRSTGRYAKGVIFLHTIRLFEQLILLLMVLTLDTEILVAAITLLMCRLVGTLSIALHLAYANPKSPFGLKKSNWTTFRRLLPASLGFMLMPLGYALFIQGMTILAASFGASYAALLATTRTLTSLGRQLVSVVAHASWPELSRAFGGGNKTLVKKLFML